MIASLHGVLTHILEDSLIVDVAGVGYRVVVSDQTRLKLPALGSKAFLFIYTAVREDDISLYGFAEEQEKRIFQKLISVNGIGPKLALTILSGILPGDLVQALMRKDLVKLTSISGIGKKTAERMILDLRDKLAELAAWATQQSPTGGKPTEASEREKIFEEAVSALVNLGYSQIKAEMILANIPLEGATVEAVIRQALRTLSEGKSK